jgi:hypothetical protein
LPEISIEIGFSYKFFTTSIDDSYISGNDLIFKVKPFDSISFP